MVNVAEKYADIKKKFNLPDYANLDREFELSIAEDIPTENVLFFLRAIRKRITEKIDSICKILDDIIHPESTFASFRESNSFDDDERASLIELYKKIVFYSRLSLELSVDDDEKKNSEFINDFYKEWFVLKKELLPFFQKLKESWQKDVSKNEIIGYFG